MFFVCFLTSFQSFDLLSVISDSTRPVLQQQICVYTQLLTGMTFNNNNNRRCLDLLATMATGISQRLLLCWWCPHRKIEGANWLCLWDRPVLIALVATSAALNFHKEGQTRRQSSVIVSPQPVWNSLSVCLPDSKQAASERNVCLWFRP